MLTWPGPRGRLGWARCTGKGLWYPVGFTGGVEAGLGQLPADSFVFL